MHHIDLRYAATRIAVAVAAAAALAGTAVTGAGAATRGQGAAPRAHVTATPGTRLWVRRLNGTGNDSDVALSAAVSPGGGRVFVTGGSLGITSGEDFLTAAYRTDSGAKLWSRRYNGHDDVAVAVAVSRNGKRVYVTGFGPSAGASDGYLTVGYRVSDGTQLWARGYDGPQRGDDLARAMAVSPTQNRVFVTGSSPGRTSGDDYATIAYHG